MVRSLPRMQSYNSIYLAWHAAISFDFNFTVMPGTLRRFNCTYGKTGRKLFTLCCYTLEVIILTEIMNLGTGKLGNRTKAMSALIVQVPTWTLMRAQRTKVSLPLHTEGYRAAFGFLFRENRGFLTFLNPLALELDIYSLAHHLCKMWIFYEPRRVTLGNTRHFVEE
jgi:hypothetical protein